MKVLIVEDEKELSSSIYSYLNDRQFICEVAYDYHTAMEKISLYDYSCIILDITLPNGSGLDILRKMKSIGKAEGVLIISAKNSLDDRVNGLEIGADDYLTKPFHLPELSARVFAIVRRKFLGGNNIIDLDHLALNTETKEIQSDDQRIILTRKEYELLLYFISNKNKVVTKESIVEHLWGDDYDMADHYDFIYSHIKNLRKKISQLGAPDMIKAVYGMGYKFVVKN